MSGRSTPKRATPTAASRSASPGASVKRNRMRRSFTFYTVVTALLLAASADALTVAEILALKKAGVSDETLQMLIERERDEKIMALRAGTWKLSDGRTVYTTEGLPNPEAE